MKQFLLCLSLIGCLSPLFSQSTFSSNTFNIGAGDSIIAITFEDSVTNPGPAGANQTWDFSFLTEAGRDTFVIQMASAVSQSAFFPNADFAGANIVPDAGSSNPQVSGSANSFFSYGTAGELLFWGTSTEVTANGMTITQNAPYSDPETVFSYPMMYEDSLSDDFEGNFDAGGGVILTRKGSNYRKYDGYGTLIMPNGQTFTDVIRIRLVQTYQDTSTNPLFPINSTYQTENVYYVGQGKKLPYLQYNRITSTIAPNPSTTAHFVVAYPNSGAVGTRDLLSPEAFSLAPNPNQGLSVLRIDGEMGEKLSVEIMDLQGRILNKAFDGITSSGKSEISIDNSNLLPGFYLVKVDLGNKTGLLKMQVEK